MDSAQAVADTRDQISTTPSLDPTVLKPAASVGVQRLRYLLAQGMPAPDVVALLLRSNPGERNQMLGLLQQILGNSFVRRVIDAQTVSPAGPAAGTGSDGHIFVDATGVHATGSLTKPDVTASGAVNAGLAATGGIAADASGDFKTSGLSGNGTITDANGQVSGNGTVTYTGKNGTVTGDIHGGPSGITADASGHFKTGGLSGNGTITDANGQVSGNGTVTYTGKAGSVTGDIQGGPTGVTVDASGTITKGNVTADGTVTDANGRVSGNGTVTYTGKDGSIKGNVSGGPDGLSAGLTGTITKGNVTADGTVADTNGKLSGSGNVVYTGKAGSVKGNVTAGPDGVSGGVSGTIAKDGVTAQGGVTASTSTGINASASADVKGQKGSVDYEAGADARAGTSGISADAFGKINKDLGNGKSFAGAGLAEFHNGVAGGGAAVGFTDKGKFGVEAGATVETDGITAGVEVEIKNVTIGIVTKNLQLERISVSLGPRHKLLNKVFDIAGDVVVAAVSPVGFSIGEIEKLARHGKPAGIDKLFQLVGGPDNDGIVADGPDRKADGKARAAVANSALVLTAADMDALAAMKMLDPAGQIDVSVTPDLLAQRLAASPLTAEQKQVLLAAYHELGNGTKHIEVTHESGVPAVYALLQSGTKDPQAFANLLDSHPGDMPPMLQEIVQTPGYGLEFANQVARAAGIMDKVVVAPGGTVRFAPPGVAA